MKKLKSLFSDTNTDPASVIMIIWGILLSLLVVAGIIKIVIAISTGEVTFSNIQLF